MRYCILCENGLEPDEPCKFCGLDNRLTKLNRKRKIYEFVWPDLRILYPAGRGTPIRFFVKSNRARIIEDLKKESIKIAKRFQD